MIVSASWVSSTTDWGRCNRTSASESQVNHVDKTQNMGMWERWECDVLNVLIYQHTE